MAKMLKAIHAQESKDAAREKAQVVAAALRDMKLKEAAVKVENSVEETLTYADFPFEHWSRIRTNNDCNQFCEKILTLGGADKKLDMRKAPKICSYTCYGYL